MQHSKLKAAVGSHLRSLIKSVPIHLKENNTVNGQGNKVSERNGKQKESRIKKLIDKNEGLDDSFREYEKFLKDKFLLSLLQEDNGSEEVLEELRRYNIHIDEKGFFILFLLSMDHYHEILQQYAEKQMEVLKVHIKETVEGLIFAECRGFIVDTGKNEIAVVVNLNEGDIPQEMKDAGCNLAARIRFLVTERTGHTITIGVSTPHRGLPHIRECYAEAVSSVSCRLVQGNNKVIHYENTAPQNEHGFHYPFLIEKGIMDSLKIGNGEGVYTGLESFVQYLYNNSGKDMEMVRYYFLQLLSASFRCIYETGRSYEASGLWQKEFYKALMEQETMQEMMVYMKKLYGTAIKQAEEKREGKNRELVESIVQYINEHMEADLSCETLAYEFRISSSHLRKIFKEEKGITIKDYIDQQRIERAKKILQQSSKKISQVAEVVGYSSIQAFTRTFKAYTGKSPGEYRIGQVIQLKSALSAQG